MNIIYELFKLIKLNLIININVKKVFCKKRWSLVEVVDCEKIFKVLIWVWWSVYLIIWGCG